jgi:Sulfatase
VPEQPNPSFQGRVGLSVQDSIPWWPPQTEPPLGAPNILVVLFDDVGFSDFGCYGSPIKTPTIDRLTAQGTLASILRLCAPRPARTAAREFALAGLRRSVRRFMHVYR